MSYITFEKQRIWQAPKTLQRARGERALEKSSAELALELGASKPANAVAVRNHLELVISNICLNNRRYFCLPGHKDSFTLTKKEITERVMLLEDSYSLSIKSGLNPEYLFENYLDIFKAVSCIRKNFSAFSIDEVIYHSALLKYPIKDILSSLKSAGVLQLGSSSEVSIRKNVSDALRVHELAHQMGLSSNAELQIEGEGGVEQLPSHLERLNNIQRNSNSFSGLELRFDDLDIETELKLIAFCKLQAKDFPKVSLLLPHSLRRKSLLALEYGVDEVVLIESYPKF